MNPRHFRFFAGILVCGESIEVEVVPTVDGILSVSIRGTPAATGLRETCRLGDPEARRAFTPGEVRIEEGLSDGAPHGLLVCLALNDLLPGPHYREGFTVPLDAGQAEILRAEVPRLERVATLARALALRLRELLPEPIDHKLEFAANIAARVILDARAPADALRLEAALHWVGKDSPFCAAFGDAEVVRLLCGAHSAAQP